jgi:alpha-tubulin suppressor-like RCC1 family protein
MSVGDRFSCGLQPDHNASCWGRGLEGQFGNGNLDIAAYPTRVYDGLFVERLATGYAHGCVIDPADRVHCWGESGRGQTGRLRRSATALPARVFIP